MSEKLRMDAYYYFFDETGCIEIDRVLSAVATAGKSYHHTQDWNDDEYGNSPVYDIQVAAETAADRVKELEEAMKRYIDDIGSADPKDHPYLATTAWGFMKEFKTILGESK